VGRLTVALAHLARNSRGATGLMLMSAIVGSLELVPRRSVSYLGCRFVPFGAGLR
jgi:hypothetical protein